MSDRKTQIQSAFRLNLEQQKHRAKDLLRAARANNASALARVAEQLGSNQKSELKLGDAQFVIARELGFTSWTKLKEHIVSMNRERAAIRAKQFAPDGDVKTLHIRCGSDIQQTLLAAGFSGDFLEHSNPYCQGPVTSASTWLEQRARFVADAYGQYLNFSFDESLARLREGEQKLAMSTDNYERVVLWMEHDSYDQLVLSRCLAHYASTKPPRILEYVSVNHFPGAARFIGIGQLPEEALRLLWTRRQPVTREQMTLGFETWNALTSDDPRRLAAIMRSGTAVLPDLAPALHRHLQELPSTKNGLSLTQHLLLLTANTCRVQLHFESRVASISDRTRAAPLAGRYHAPAYRRRHGAGSRKNVHARSGGRR